MTCRSRGRLASRLWTPLQPHRDALSLVELLVAVTILAILAGSAIPMTQLIVAHSKEVELKEDLRSIRNAIDKYYDRQDRKKPDAKEETKYPKTLDDLVREHCLRRIPRDPFCPDQAGTSPEECWAIVASTDTEGLTTAPAGSPFVATPFEEGPAKEKVNVYDVHSRSEEVSPFGNGPYKDF